MTGTRPRAGTGGRAPSGGRIERSGSGARANPAGRTGRRPGNPDTRQAILDAARREFAARGFSASTVRAIAAAAGVDPALVHHYFGTKDNLFLQTVQVPVNPRAVVDTLTEGPIETLGLRMAATVLGVWESPVGVSLAAALRSAMDDPELARPVREFLLTQVIGRVLRQADCAPEEREIRSALLASQMMGVLMGRYVLRMEPLASQSIDELIPNIGVTLQRYLTGPLQLAGAPTTAPDPADARGAAG